VLLGAGTSAAAPVSVTLNYSCPFPLIGTQQLQIAISADVPSTATVGEAIPAFDVTTVTTVPETATQGLSLVGATTVEGSAEAGSTVVAPEGTTAITVPATIPSTPVPASGSFQVTATGSSPSLTFAQPGTATINVGDIKLTLHPKKADGTDTGLGTFDSQCTQVAGQTNTLATIQITGGTTTEPPTTTTEPPATTTEPPTTTTEPTTSQPTTTTSTPGGGLQYGYALNGSSTLKTLGAKVPLTGGIEANLDLATGAFTGALTLDPSTVKASLFRFIPITASVNFQQQGQTTGSLAGGVLTAASKTTIALPVVKVFGFPISKTPKCQTSSPSDIGLASAPGFDPLAGGTLSGTYDIASLTGCGPLNGLISTLATGPGNTIDVTLTPKAS
jgi:hypothetical protein